MMPVKPNNLTLILPNKLSIIFYPSDTQCLACIRSVDVYRKAHETTLVMRSTERSLFDAYFEPISPRLEVYPIEYPKCLRNLLS